VFVRLDHVVSRIVNGRLRDFAHASRAPLHHEQYGRSMKARPQRQRRETAMSVQRARSMLRELRESRKLLEQLEGQLKQMERFAEDIQVNIKQVWKRKNNGLLVKVSGLIFQEPKRVMWRGLPDQDNPSAYGTVTETEFKEQYEYQDANGYGGRFVVHADEKLTTLNGIRICDSQRDCGT
jgi:hypothetical protein